MYLFTVHQPPGLHTVLCICQAHFGLRASVSAISSPQNYASSVPSLTSFMSLFKHHFKSKASPTCYCLSPTLLNFLSQSCSSCIPNPPYHLLTCLSFSCPPLQLQCQLQQNKHVHCCTPSTSLSRNSYWHIACTQEIFVWN